MSLSCLIQRKFKMTYMFQHLRCVIFKNLLLTESTKLKIDLKIPHAFIPPYMSLDKNIRPPSKVKEKILFTIFKL